MKKVLALVLALATVLSLGVVAFAAEAEVDGAYASVWKKDADAATTVTDNAISVNPDTTYYYVLQDVGPGGAEISIDDLANDDYFKCKIEKAEGSKYFASIKLLQKKVDGNRKWVIEVKTKDDMTDNEYKLQFDVTFTSKDKWEKLKDTAAAYKTDGVVVTLPTQTIWMSNDKIEEEDYDTTAGKGGIFIKPVKNEENEIVWEDENNNLATLTFDADSSTKYYFPKLSTKWDNVKYAELFNDQDAFVRSWVGTPEISSTSRAVLELNVPYVDDDDELTVDEGSVIVYEETADGELIDITDKGSFDYNDDDEYVFTMKTRRLGTYIFAEAPVTEADADAEVPADEVVDADKVNPGTGF